MDKAIQRTQKMYREENNMVLFLLFEFSKGKRQIIIAVKSGILFATAKQFVGIRYYHIKNKECYVYFIKTCKSWKK